MNVELRRTAFPRILQIPQHSVARSVDRIHVCLGSAQLDQLKPEATPDVTLLRSVVQEPVLRSAWSHQATNSLNRLILFCFPALPYGIAELWFRCDIKRILQGEATDFHRKPKKQ